MTDPTRKADDPLRDARVQAAREAHRAAAPPTEGLDIVNGLTWARSSNVLNLKVEE